MPHTATRATVTMTRLTSAKIRRMSRRRQKIAAQRRMSAYLRAYRPPVTTKP